MHDERADYFIGITHTWLKLQMKGEELHKMQFGVALMNFLSWLRLGKA